MASQAQINANRQNSGKSTGPKTAKGKAKVARNAIKHGLCSMEAVIHGEEKEEYERHRLRRQIRNTKLEACPEQRRRIRNKSGSRPQE